jgi:hypothetical protein
MLAVAGLATIFGLIVLGSRESTTTYNNGPHQAKLARGDAVVAHTETGPVIALEIIPSPGQVAIRPGTRCTVVRDAAFDLDACTEDRLIVVRVRDGPHGGRVGYILRRDLRKS